MAGFVAVLLSTTLLACLISTTLIFGLGRQSGGVTSIRGANPARGAVEILERQLLNVQGLDMQKESLLHTSVGHLYRDQGRFADAVAHYEAAQRLATTTGDARGFVVALHNTGVAQLQQGRLMAAQESLQKAAGLLDQASDMKFEVQRALGNALREQGHLPEAFELYSQAAALGAAERPELLMSLEADEGEARMRSGDFRRAVEILQRALTRYDGTKGRPGMVEEQALARVQSTLGAVYHWQGDVDHAMRLYLKAMEKQKSLLRRDHEDLVSTQLSHARALRDLGKFGLAMEAVNNLETALRSGPQEGPDLSRALLVKAELLREAVRHKDAEQTIHAALQLQSLCFTDGVSPEEAVAYNTLGSILHDQNKLQSAQEQYLTSLHINEKTVGPNHPETAAAHNNLGTLYTDLGDDKSAEAHFRKCLEIQLRVMPADSSDLSTSFNNLAAVLFRRGSLEEAAALLDSAIQVMDSAKVPRNNPERVLYTEHLEHVKQVIASRSPKDEGASPLDTVLES